MRYDVVTIGNALVDALLSFDPQDKHLHYDSAENKLTLNMGEKFLAKDCSFAMGGGAGRVAVGLSRLGFKTGIFAETGTDELSEIIVSTLKSSGVDTRYLLRSGGGTSFTVGINYRSERTLLTHHVEYEHAFDFKDLECKWVYLGSLGPKWESAYRKTEKFVRENGAYLAFNPGLTQFRTGKETFFHLLPFCEIFFVNKQEAEILIGGKEEEEALLKKIQKMGPKTVVITDGKNGSKCITQSGNVFSIKAHPVEVREKTGAGDAYIAGFLAGILDGHTVQRSMAWGSINSASTIGHLGGEKGLLTREHLEELAERAPDAMMIKP